MAEGATSGPFEPATGDGPAVSGADREAAVGAAFDGLLRIRRVMGGPGTTVPAPWERLQPVRAVAIALEAAGIEPSAVDGAGVRGATGYRVGAAERPGSVRVEWLGPPGSGAEYAANESLQRCATALRPLGWVALAYRGPRRHHYLEVEPAG
ncbi:hypothetical protein [Streptomyces sp. NBC_00083]|uniref:hypothetical protein n=1 Tax=Streptomyces sp. NBC_00083 TaxID=2975647 RepID=UPI0022520862|nr:hypothetical protein [Streptomyces sp. NBC_00083]MCX5384051.1 hypothetical protein [Streptomyces sp. NBC_00083]